MNTEKFLDIDYYGYVLKFYIRLLVNSRKDEVYPYLVLWNFMVIINFEVLKLFPMNNDGFFYHC